MTTNNYRKEIETIILNGVKTNIITHYYLHKDALGGNSWHREGVSYEKAEKSQEVQKEYQISAKQACYINGKSSTTFEVYEVVDNSNIFVGNGFVLSKGVARDKTCLKAWLCDDF